MIDMTEFKQCLSPELRAKSFPDDLGPSILEATDPPEGEFVFLLPAHITGFHMQDHKWSASLTAPN